MAEERADPAVADRRYQEAIAALRERTRDGSRFALLLGENMEYGFRRNCLGLRPAALLVAGGTLVVSLGLFAVAHEASGAYLAAAAIAFLALLVWWRLVTEEWVRLAADRYADQLLASVEHIRAEQG